MQNGKIRTPATSFIVRVWANEGDGPRMRGEIEHLGTGERRYFDSYWSLLDQIENWRAKVEALG